MSHNQNPNSTANDAQSSSVPATEGTQENSSNASFFRSLFLGKPKEDATKKNQKGRPIHFFRNVFLTKPATTTTAVNQPNKKYNKPTYGGRGTGRGNSGAARNGSQRPQDRDDTFLTGAALVMFSDPNSGDQQHHHHNNHHSGPNQTNHPSSHATSSDNTTHHNTSTHTSYHYHSSGGGGSSSGGG
ncbi:hypothetical protein FRB91_009711, partial [Serendipita sp. 411]